MEDGVGDMEEAVVDLEEVPSEGDTEEGMVNTDGDGVMVEVEESEVDLEEVPSEEDTEEDMVNTDGDGDTEEVEESEVEVLEEDMEEDTVMVDTDMVSWNFLPRKFEDSS